jgi:ABC-2 type transport system ATP-binding protein
MATLETEALTRRFGALTAVDALTMSVDTGEVFGLLGPNGAGKTTVIKMLTTLLPPTSGTARVAGFDIRRGAARVRRAIGYVPQALSVDGALTGYENLLIFAKLYDIPRPERASRLREALDFMGLTEVADKWKACDLATFCPFTGCTSPLGGRSQRRLLEGEERAPTYLPG